MLQQLLVNMSIRCPMSPKEWESPVGHEPFRLRCVCLLFSYAVLNAYVLFSFFGWCVVNRHEVNTCNLHSRTYSLGSQSGLINDRYSCSVCVFRSCGGLVDTDELKVMRILFINWWLRTSQEAPQLRRCYETGNRSELN